MKKGWPEVEIGDAFKTSAGGTPLRSKKQYFDGGTIPWLMSGEVAQREIFSCENFITPLGLQNCSARLLPIDSVLIAMYGATAGQVGILKFEACTNQAVCAIHPNDRFLPPFVYYALLAQQQQLIDSAVGNAQPNLSQIKLRKVGVPVPRWPSSSGLSAFWTKRLRASPPPKPTPKRTSKTPEPSSKATSNPSSPNAAMGGWRRSWATCAYLRMVTAARTIPTAMSMLTQGFLGLTRDTFNPTELFRWKK